MKPTEILLSIIVIDLMLVGFTVIGRRMSEYLRMKSSRYDHYRGTYDTEYELRGIPLTPSGWLDQFLYYVVEKQLQFYKKVKFW